MIVKWKLENGFLLIDLGEIFDQHVIFFLGLSLGIWLNSCGIVKGIQIKKLDKDYHIVRASDDKISKGARLGFRIAHLVELMGKYLNTAEGVTKKERA